MQTCRQESLLRQVKCSELGSLRVLRLTLLLLESDLKRVNQNGSSLSTEAEILCSIVQLGWNSSLNTMESKSGQGRLSQSETWE